MLSPRTRDRIQLVGIGLVLLMATTAVLAAFLSHIAHVEWFI